MPELDGVPLAVPPADSVAVGVDVADDERLAVVEPLSVPVGVLEGVAVAVGDPDADEVGVGVGVGGVLAVELPVPLSDPRALALAP